MLIVCDKINTISFINGIKYQLFLIFLDSCQVQSLFTAGIWVDAQHKTACGHP